MIHTGIAVLTYHSFSGYDMLYMHKRLAVSLDMFRVQMDWLHRNGYITMSHNTLNSYLQSGNSLPDKCIMLTFDDGYQSWHRYARDILSYYNFTATMFLSTGYVDGKYKANGWEAVEKDNPLTWSQVRDLASSGWSVQAHGHFRHKWTETPLSDVARELNICKNEIEQRLGTPVDSVSFPYGSYNSQVLHHLKGAGYNTGYSMHSGKLFLSSDKMRIPRITINSHDTISTFERKVRTGYGSASQGVGQVVSNLLFGNPRVKDLMAKVVGS